MRLVCIVVCLWRNQRRDYKFNRWRVCRKIASASTCEDGEKLFVDSRDGSRPEAEARARAPTVAAAVVAEISRLCSVCSSAAPAD